MISLMLELGEQRYFPQYEIHTGGHISQNPGRATTWHSFGKDTNSELSRQAVRSEPTRIRPTYPFPSLHLIQQGGDSGDEYDEDFAVTDRSKKKLVWVDALNKWVPEHQLHPRPYMSFIGNAPVLEKHGKVLKELYSGDGDDRSEVKTCERFETHMGRRSSLSQSSPNKQRNNDKRDAIRKRAQEMAEQRKQRKAYSTPLYTSLTERKYKARIQSCKTPATTPVTPRHPFDKAPSPREVWQSKDKEQNKKPEPAPPPVPVKKEISIRIVSPEVDDPETELSDDSKEKGDKKVTFLEESKANKTKKDKKKKDDTDSSDISTNNDTNNNNKNNNNSNNNETDAKVAEKNLIDSLEKQRQQQILEQKRLLKEEQKKENERIEKEHQTETEKLQKAKEMQKQLLLQKNQDNESHYENTAGKRRKGKTDAPKTQKAKPVKPDKAGKKNKKLEEKEKSGEKLPITKPSEVNATLPVQEVEEAPKPKSPHQERRRSIVEKRPIVKKERRDGRKCIKKEEEKPEKLPDFEIEVRPVESWIYDKDDFSDKKETEKGSSQASTEPLPSLDDDLTPEFIEAQVKAKEKRRKSVLANLINTENTVRKWKKPGQLDSSYNDEMRRLELAEERRKKQMEMFDRLKNRRMSIFGNTDDDGSPRFEDYGFLSKYCIFTKGNIEMYRHAFDAVDESNQGWLEGEDVMIALRGVNNRLTEAEEEYLYRVLELTGYKITHGADFKMFSVLAALSQRISSLDKWMKNIIGKMDFKTLEMKMFKCKTLWECNVDKDSNSISIEQLCVELRAGGVSLEHELEVRDKLSHLHSLDLLDFLTYVPLFIMIHEAVIKNPLDDTRAK